MCAALASVQPSSLLAKFIKEDDSFLRNRSGCLADPIDRAANYFLMIDLARSTGNTDAANNLYKRSITTGVWPKEMDSFRLAKINTFIAKMNRLYPSTPIAPAVLKTRNHFVDFKESKESKEKIKADIKMEPNAHIQNKTPDSKEKKEGVQ